MTNYIYNCNSFFAVSLKHFHMKSGDVTHNLLSGKAKTVGQTTVTEQVWEGGRGHHY